MSVTPTIISDATILREHFIILSLGHGGNPATTPLVGYMKNFVLENYQWSLQQAQASYHNALKTGFYTIGWELWGGVSDQFNGLATNNNTVISNQEHCYDVELTHLILPNVVLKTGFGNRIAFYPFVYVQFAPINSTYMQPFASNHPNTALMLFKVPIRDISTPD